MPCYSPMTGYKSRFVNPSGKRSITFNRSLGYVDMQMTVPCGKCIGCLLERSRQWAVRCMHEASLYQNNCSITLTYNDENLPENGSLDIRHVQNFFKAFRREQGKVRYFLCGEYGENYYRPHYHILLFGYDFQDKQLRRVTPQGNRVYTSDILAKLWKFGFHEIGNLSYESAAYAARYCMKKVLGKDAEKFYESLGKKPEFTTMSKGIGREHAEKYLDSIYHEDCVVIKGKKQKPPKYYDKILEEIDKNKFDMIKLNRNIAMQQMQEKNPAEFTGKRLLRKYQAKEIKLKRLRRSYEEC